MTAATIRNKVHQFIDEADSEVVGVVYKLLEVYRQKNASQLTEEQKEELQTRSELYKAGKIKAYSVAEARKRLKR